MGEVSIRLACEADLPSINDIYNYYVLNSTCTFQLEPETIEARRRWFASFSQRHPVTVAELDENVIGWGALSKFRERAAYDQSVEASVYIHKDQLGRGLGRVLLVDLIERAKQLGFHTLLGGACTEQAASIKLQASLGFQPVAHLREVGFKFGRWLDVDYLQLML
jgi:phosphinothricin acetyltransferase